MRRIHVTNACVKLKALKWGERLNPNRNGKQKMGVNTNNDNVLATSSKTKQRTNSDGGNTLSWQQRENIRRTWVIN